MLPEDRFSLCRPAFSYFDRWMSDFEKEMYAAVYNLRLRIHTFNAWYQTFSQDIEDTKDYGKRPMPVSGIVSNVSAGYDQPALPSIAQQSELVHLADTDYCMFEENPEAAINAILPYLTGNKT